LKVAFRASFTRDLRKIKEQQLRNRVLNLIEQVENAATLDDIPNLKKLKGGGNYYRIRIGSYRCGLTVENDTVTFVRFLHRRDVYRYFP
jgi:mRNA interferase RelE/StbE